MEEISPSGPAVARLPHWPARKHLREAEIGSNRSGHNRDEWLMRDVLDTCAFGARRPKPLVEKIIEMTRRQADSWAGRRFAYLLRRAALRRLDGPVDTEAMGVRLRLYPFSNI